MSEVIVVDSMMGSGKTSWAIQYINEHPKEPILYITPYLAEVDRIKGSVSRPVFSPRNLGKGKIDDLALLIREGKSIASTHSLFARLDERCREMLQNANYTLIMDEVMGAVAPYMLGHADDIPFLMDNGVIKKGENGRVLWCAPHEDTAYNDVRNLAQQNSLFYVNDKILMWRYPSEIFTLFPKVFVMTYLFQASILRYYFDLNRIQYQRRSVQKTEKGYELTEYFKPDCSQFKDKIHVYTGKIMNCRFMQCSTVLSATWFKNSKEKQEMKLLRNSIQNFFQNVMKAKGKRIIWTTFEDSKAALQAGGYTKRFVPCNCRGTNDYAEADCLCYAVNLYPHVGVTQYFSHNGIKIDQDLYALSEMIQWIWRSRIRSGGEITVYIPSRRMRNLLLLWLDNRM